MFGDRFTGQAKVLSAGQSPGKMILGVLIISFPEVIQIEQKIFFHNN